MLPALPGPAGTVVPGKPEGSRIGVWLMPDNVRHGALEDFLGMLVPPGDPCWTYSDEVVDAAKSLGAPYSANDRSKARVHSWLAWQDPSGQPFGVAIAAQLLSADAPAASAFFGWLSRVFLDP